jgi:hypothetical protein
LCSLFKVDSSKSIAYHIFKSVFLKKNYVNGKKHSFVLVNIYSFSPLIYLSKINTKIKIKIKAENTLHCEPQYLQQRAAPIVFQKNKNCNANG